MKRSDDRGGSRKAGFTVVEGGRSAAQPGTSQPNGAQAGSDLSLPLYLDDFMLMVLGLLTCRSTAEGEPSAMVPIDPTALDKSIGRLIERGSAGFDPRTQHLYLTEQGRSDAAFHLKAYRGFESLLEQATELGMMPDGPSSAARAPVRAFRFRIDLDLDGLHPCWREIIVPATMSFDVFHMAIQSAFLFAGYHLYDFELRTHGEMVRIAEQENLIENDFFRERSSRRNFDACQMFLDDVFPKTRSARYSYDYGDGWELKIKLVETLDAYDGPWPYCTKGAGDAPPEDVGGIGGFERFLRAIADEGDPEHEFLSEWGESQLWEPFSLEAVNRRIAIWPTAEFDRLWNEAHKW